MKACLKIVGEVLATALVFVPFLIYRLERLAIGSRALAGWTQAFSLLPGSSGAYLRRAFYRLIFPRCGTDCWINFGTVFSHGTAEIGDLVYIGVYGCLGDVTLEDDVLLGSHVSILNGAAQHGIERLDVPIREQPGVWPRVRVGQGSWVGDRAVIMADVGKHCVIGAGSLVIKPIPDYAIAVGAPAKVIRYRTETEAAAWPAERDVRGSAGVPAGAAGN